MPSAFVKQFTRGRGCYIIRARGVVMYVGKSVDLKSRGESHHYRNFIENNFPDAKVEIILCRGNLDKMELRLISELSPLLNKQRNRRWIDWEVEFERRLKEMRDNS